MNEHGEFRELLLLAVAGVLRPDEQRRLEQHVAGCASCARELERMQSYGQTLRRLPSPATPAGLAERTEARVLRELARAHEGRWSEMVLAMLSLYAWTLTLTAWLLWKLFTGGWIAVVSPGFLQEATWWTGSTLLAWLTAAVAALALGGLRRTARRSI